MHQVLNEPFDRLWAGRDPFDAVFELEGEVFRNVKNRKTFRIEVDGKGFFVKIHRGIGWKEIFKNLFQFKLPVTGAANEFFALKRLSELGIATMESAAFAERNADPATKESFLITRELTDVVTLEDWGAENPVSPLRRRLVRAVARSAGTMHRAGINHRDCYICHYMLHLPTAGLPEPTVFVIDLHRAQIRKKVPYRYHVKDVAGLLFSAWSASLTRREALRFIREYSCCPLKIELNENRKFWQDVERTARKLFYKEHGTEPTWMISESLRASGTPEAKVKNA